MDFVVIGSPGSGKSSIALQLGAQFWKRRSMDFERVIQEHDIQNTYLAVLPRDLLGTVSEALEKDSIPPPLFRQTNEYRRTILWQHQPFDLHFVERPADNNRYLFRSTAVILVYDPTSSDDPSHFEQYVKTQWDTLLVAPFKGRPQVRGRRPMSVFVSKCDLVSPVKMRNLKKSAASLISSFGEAEISVHFVCAVRARGIEEALPITIANQLAYNHPPLKRETFRQKAKRKRRPFVMMIIFLAFICISAVIGISSQSSIAWTVVIFTMFFALLLCSISFGIWWKEDTASEYEKSSCLPSQYAGC